MPQQNRRCFLRSLGLGTAALATSGCHLIADQPGRKMNIVFILADDMGYGDLGCYGNTYKETPNIDALAARGVRFTDAYAPAPTCSPTRAAVLTGQYPGRSGLTQYLPGNKKHHVKAGKPLIPPDLPPGLSHDAVTIAEALRTAGYATGVFGKWHLGKDPTYHPSTHGFDVSYPADRTGHHGQKSMFHPFWPSKPELSEPGEYLTDRLAEESERFIETHRDRPFFLYLSLYSVHRPIQAKEELIEKYRAKLAAMRANPPEDTAETPFPSPHADADPVFAAMVQGIDDCVGRVRAKLESLGLEKDTAIVFLSDNGGIWIAGSNNGPLREEKSWLYEGGVREPLIVDWPGQSRTGAVCPTPVTGVDLYPTFMEMAGVAPPAGHTLDGESLGPLLRGDGDLERDAIYWHDPHYSNHGSPPCGAIRKGDWKLIEWFEDGKVELYNLAEDIGESQNLAGTLPKRADEMRRDLAAWRRRVGAKMPTRR
jgi:arylsulfatase A-like enzyme